MVSHSVQLLFIKPLILPHTSHTKSFALSFQFFTRLAAVFAEECGDFGAFLAVGLIQRCFAPG